MLLFERNINGGIQKVYRFDNGFGASVVRNSFSYGGNRGLWEMAVLEFNGDGWDLTYETPITDNVLGYLSNEDVEDYLLKIQSL